MDNHKLSVTQLVGKIKNMLEPNFQHILVVGEVSNLSSSASGHWYFTLSDRDASVSVALFKMDAYRNPLMKKIKKW